MSLIVRVAGRAVNVSGLQCTATRRGGFETCSFTISAAANVSKGDDVRVWDGLFTVWHGFVNSTGIRQRGIIRSASVTAIGYGALLKRNPYSMIYIDRLLSRWTGPSTVRLTALTAQNPNSGPSTAIDPSNGNPGLEFRIEGVVASSGQAESMYDAGASNLIRQVGFSESAVANITPSANYLTQMFASITGDGSFESASGDGDATARADALYTLSTPRRFLHYLFRLGAASASDVSRQWKLVGLRVIGDHSLPYQARASALDGYMAVDVIEDAVIRSGAGFSILPLGGVGEDTVVPQCAAYEPIMPEEWIEQMIVLLGWNYGTWEPDPFSDRPVFMYGAPPTEATATVAYTACSDDSIDDVLTNQYTSAVAVSTDPAGYVTVTEVEKANPAVPDWWTNTLQLNLGVTVTPETQAAFLLALSQDTGRAAGSVRLPAVLTGGMPSHHLRPGRDRLTINGLPGAGGMLQDSGAVRGDTFSLDRITVSQDQAGSVVTTVDVDSGEDLVETLTARIGLAQQLAQVGG
jgi:hypothetical protein